MTTRIFTLCAAFAVVCCGVSCEKPAAGFTIIGGRNAASGERMSAMAPRLMEAPRTQTEAAGQKAPESVRRTAVIRPEMPKWLFVGPPIPIREGVPGNFEGFSKQPAKEAAVPEGVSLLSRGKPVTSSDQAPIGDVAVVTDGEKSGEDGYFVDLEPGKQWVQIDLGEPKEIWLLWVWHFHKMPVIYRDVIAQVSDDPEFRTATTVFNNDDDNSAGLGAGADPAYLDTAFGRAMEVSGVKGRYVRLWSNGRDCDEANHYIEIEVYGK